MTGVVRILIVVIMAILAVIIHELSHLTTAKLLKAKVDDVNFFNGRHIFSLQVRNIKFMFNSPFSYSKSKKSINLHFSGSVTVNDPLRRFSKTEKILILSSGIMSHLVLSVCFIIYFFYFQHTKTIMMIALVNILFLLHQLFNKHVGSDIYFIKRILQGKDLFEGGDIDES